MSPVGILLVVGFVIIFIICLYVDKKTSKKFSSEISQKYQAQDSFENIFITANGDLLYYLPSGTLVGYKKWNIKDIAYVSTYRGSFSILDSNKKEMRGEYLTPSKKNVKEKLYVSFTVGPDKANQYVEFIKKHGSHIQHLSAGKVIE